MSRAMTGTLRTLALALAILTASIALPASASTAYTQNLYRATAFSTQAVSYYCVAATGQMVWNLAKGQSNHTSAQQAAFYAYGRKHNAYSYTEPGIDPQGDAAMLNYELGTTAFHYNRSTSLAAALKLAAQRIRVTGRPAVLFAANGAHAWLMSGYTATANPRLTSSFTVTYVYIEGPLYPHQVAKLGWFDLPPNTRIAATSMGNPFWKYSEYYAFGDSRWTPWNGYWITVTA
jgi:hypothetical protein